MSDSSWAPSPPADTLTTLQKGIAGYVLMPTDPEMIDCANQGIRRAIDMLNMRNWNWALAYDDITFVAGYYDYQLGQMFRAARNFDIWNPSNESQFRLGYKSWKTFAIEHPSVNNSGKPCYYSCQNVHANGLVTLDAAPDTGWISAYPMGRILYYRRIQYPTVLGQALDVPSEVVAYIQAQAEGYAADRFAVQKARDAYTRADFIMRELVRDDCHGQNTDWED